MILAYSSYSKLVSDVTTVHTALRFEIFWRKTANWQEGNRQVWSGNRDNYTESSDITTCMWIHIGIGHSGVYRGHYRDVKGRLFVSYDSYLVLLKYMTGSTYRTAVSELGQPLMGCRNHKGDVTAAKEV